MGRMGKWLPILTVAIGVASSAEASRPLRYEEIPEPLKPWSEWVTYGREAHACPFLHGHGDDGDREDLCAWPGKLELRMASSGGTFVQNWTLFTEGFVPLPGDDVHFPEDVRAGNSAAPVVMRGGRPHIYLKPGAYRIGGTFHWATLPDSLMVPEPTGLLSLVVDGKNVEAVNREASGLVWLRVGESAVAEENRVELSVYRLIADDSPLQITTRIQLRVSGKNREIRLKHPLLEGSVAWSLTSALPARLDNSGELHVQVRPGTWNVDLVARGDQPVAELTYRATDELWPAEELWSFIAHPEIRTVVVENGTAVDPQQTTLPAEWQKLPTYRLKSGEAFHLVLKQRAGAEIRPDKLSLHRVYWLDFRGGGLTFRDQITGLFQSSYRLEMPAPMHLGRVTVDGRDQLITQRKGKELSGVEIRQGAAHLAADGRIESPNGQLPVAGWLSALDHASATLYLPPGWRLFHASGVDHASNTWLGGWTLLDLFLVLLVAVATDRLWGHKWAALALVMMVLIVPEQEAPGWIWLVALALEGISRLKVADRFSGWLRRARITTLLLFLTVFLPFAIGHLRAALYPSLQSQEHGLLMLSSGQALNYSQRAQQLDTYNDQELSKFSAFGRAAKANSDGSVETPKGAIGVAPAAPPVAEPAEQERDEKTEAVEDAPSVPESRMMKRSPMPSQSSGGMGAYQPQLDFNQVDVKAAIQTGPGLPEWTGAQVALGWSGPVEASQQFRLWLVSPAMNFVLAVLRVLLLVVFLLRVFATPKLWQSLGLRRVGRVAAIMAIGASVLGGTAHAEPLPSSNQLEELKTRLLANPVCFPDCASVGRMRVESTGDALRLRVEIHAQATTGVPLPGQSEHFSVREITVDGKPAAGVRREGDGHLWLVVAPGVHQIILDAVAAKKEVVQISLPLLPHRVESQLSGWQLRGIDENGRPVGTLELVRVRTASIVGTPGQEQ